ncbi:MAG: PIG-L family deacetylase [Bacteroidetes bacterium]|nr:PIG-L family deacetylase [Bacteroidota bacterium]
MKTLFVLFFSFCSVITFAQAPKPSILIVTAHPDDDALFSGAVYRITHDLGGTVDLALVTNGEGGYKYSTLGEAIYGLKLTEEAIGREHLPRIRKMELMKGGEIVGIRNYFFLDEHDVEFTTDMEVAFASHWDTTRVKQRFHRILKENKYDFIFTMLATESTHGHHKGAAILMMQVVSELPKDKRPIVLSGTMFSHEAGKPSSYSGFQGYSQTKVSSDTAFVTFDRMQKFGYNNRLNYQIIGNWVIAEHKSQGSMQLLMNRGEIECYWFLDMNRSEDFKKVYTLFSNISPQFGKK